MRFTPISLDDAFQIELEKIEDQRGFFARCFCEEEFGERGLPTHWAQMNISRNRYKGTLRGLHFQRPPKAEVKVVRCLRGAIWDVIVDLRWGSRTFGEWFGTTLTEENYKMMLVPKGFAHGFQTLQSDTELLYLHSESYSPDLEGGVHYADSELAIPWPIPVEVISAFDCQRPLLCDLGELVV